MTTTVTQRAREILDEALAPIITNPQWHGWENARQAVQRALDEPRPRMSDDEMLQRARRAAIAGYRGVSEETKQRIMSGRYDTDASVQAALAALSDLNTPLPVDPVVAACREIVTAVYQDFDIADDSAPMKAAIAAYKAGQAG